MDRESKIGGGARFCNGVTVANVGRKLFAARWKSGRLRAVDAGRLATSGPGARQR
jgi:hypothetical protein